MGNFNALFVVDIRVKKGYLFTFVSQMIKEPNKKHNYFAILKAMIMQDL